MNATFQLREGVFFEDFGREVLIFSLKDYRPHLVDGVAARVFLLTDGRTPAPDIARRVAGEYGQDEGRVQSDVMSFYRELESRGIVRESV